LPEIKVHRDKPSAQTQNMARLLLDLKPDSDNPETHNNRPLRGNLAALVDELGGDQLGGAGEEGLGEVLGKRGGYGSGLVSTSKSLDREFHMYLSQLERQRHLSHQEHRLNTRHAKRTPNIHPYIFLTQVCKFYPNEP